MKFTEDKEKVIQAFDANNIGDAHAQIFGLPFSLDQSEVILLPVPWEVTVSYKAGTAKGPKAIKDASIQVDLFDTDLKDAWKYGIGMQQISTGWKQVNNKLRKKAGEYLEKFGEGKQTPEDQFILEEINDACNELKEWVYTESKNVLDQNKYIGLIGGDHSTPLGLYEALAEKYPDFGILHIDAHADLREAYEGFTYSHASIMFNALKIDQVKKIVQVGLRDLCDAEMQLIQKSKRRVVGFFNHEIKTAMYEGITWKVICDKIIAELPQHVHISFDIDGLDPKLCPNTGTPVPGGLEYEQAIYLMKQLANSGKKIISFDLVEVAPGKDEWDANVGARLLYKMCNLLLKSNLS